MLADREGRQSPGFVLMAGWVLGAALQLQQAALWAVAAYAALTLGGIAVMLTGYRWPRRRPRPGRGWRGALAVAAVLAVGVAFGAGLTGWRAAVYAQGVLEPALEGRDVVVTGVVAQMPQHDEGGVRFRLDVESARLAGAAGDTASAGEVALPPRLALGWYAANSGLWARAAEGAAPGPLHAGERWRLPVKLKAPHGNVNPHGFDQELSLWEQGVQATGYVRDGAGDLRPLRLAVTWQRPLERAREAVRDAVFERIADRRQAGVVAALVTGDQSAIERTDWDIFRTTGVAHLMSISGLHVTMFAWLAGLAVAAGWRRSRRLMLWLPAPHAGLLGGVLLAALYALFSGGGVPSQRTVWMLAVVGLLRLTGRRWPWPHVWLLACTTVVAADPWALMQPGFWLSFVAVGALFASEPPGGRPRVAGWRGHAQRLAREQAVVTLALTPLTVLLFQQVSVVGLLANAVAIPWVTLLVTPLAMLGVLLPPLWTAAAGAVQGLNACLQVLANLPMAAVSMPAPPLWMAMAGLAGGLLLAMRLPAAVRLLGLPLLLPVLFWQVPRPPAGDFDLLAIDIGQGNALLVRTATHSLLYDAGPRYSLESDAGQRVIVPLLRAQGERLDTLVLSHRDTDHTGGAPAVLAAQPQAALLSSIEPTHPLQALRPARRCEAGQRWVWDGVEFEVLHPDASDYASFGKPNAVSCVLRVRNDRAAVLLTGDIERLQEAALVARAGALHADFLLAPHHGSKTSSSPALLAAVAPAVAVAQAGYRNRFGHPAADVEARYREAGIRLVDSAHCGAARWTSLRPDALQCEREIGRRYWHHAVP